MIYDIEPVVQWKKKKKHFLSGCDSPFNELFPSFTMCCYVNAIQAPEQCLSRHIQIYCLDLIILFAHAILCPREPSHSSTLATELAQKQP